MTYYIYVTDGKLNGTGTCISNGDLNIEVSKEMHDAYDADNLLYIWNGEEIVENPNYEEEKQAQEKQAQIAVLKEQIDIIDNKRIRAVCEPSIKDETTGETWLDYYNKQIQDLREQIKNLGG